MSVGAPARIGSEQSGGSSRSRVALRVGSGLGSWRTGYERTRSSVGVVVSQRGLQARRDGGGRSDEQRWLAVTQARERRSAGGELLRDGLPERRGCSRGLRGGLLASLTEARQTDSESAGSRVAETQTEGGEAATADLGPASGARMASGVCRRLNGEASLLGFRDCDRWDRTTGGTAAVARALVLVGEGLTEEEK